MSRYCGLVIDEWCIANEPLTDIYAMFYESFLRQGC